MSYENQVAAGHEGHIEGAFFGLVKILAKLVWALAVLPFHHLWLDRAGHLRAVAVDEKGVVRHRPVLAWASSIALSVAAAVVSFGLFLHVTAGHHLIEGALWTAATIPAVAGLTFLAARRAAAHQLVVLSGREIRAAVRGGTPARRYLVVAAPLLAGLALLTPASWPIGLPAYTVGILLVAFRIGAAYRAGHLAGTVTREVEEATYATHQSTVQMLAAIFAVSPASIAEEVTVTDQLDGRILVTVPSRMRLKAMPAAMCDALAQLGEPLEAVAGDAPGQVILQPLSEAEAERREHLLESGGAVLGMSEYDGAAASFGGGGLFADGEDGGSPFVGAADATNPFASSASDDPFAA